MRVLFLSFILLFFSLILAGQTILLTPQVVASGWGEGALEGDIYITWTTGETVVETVSTSDEEILITQGFQQPWGIDWTIVGVDMIQENDISLVIFPNPTQGVIQIGFEEISNYQLTIFDLSGKKLLQKEYNGKEVQLNLCDFPSGIYFLLIRDLIKDVEQIFKLEKIQ
jgi:hypothetical protein